jgi:hypothetical protein
VSDKVTTTPTTPTTTTTTTTTQTNLFLKFAAHFLHLLDFKHRRRRVERSHVVHHNVLWLVLQRAFAK